jgi:hypothetical protein
VAVKEFKPAQQTRHAAFLAELQWTTMVDHPNLVRCYGGNSRRRWIITELCDVALSVAIHPRSAAAVRQVPARPLRPDAHMCLNAARPAAY